MTDIAAQTQTSPTILETVQDLRRYVSDHKKDGHKIALVPTMGALHDGHLELVKQGQELADIVIVSIFVNPTQFGPNEDFDAYPRTWDADLEKLSNIGANAVFHPAVTDMYDENASTTIHVKGVSEGLCGGDRPGHFDGVALIVTKLLLQSLPNIALFGEKDWQQLQVINRITADLNIPVTIRGVPIVRDKNGLALSSRNAYLSDEQYKTAIQLNKILRETADKIRSGKAIEDCCQKGIEALLASGFDKVDYLEVCDAQTLKPITTVNERPLRILAAAHLGKARLIDNMAV